MRRLSRRNPTHLALHEGVSMAAQAETTRLHEGLHLSCPNRPERDFSAVFFTTCARQEGYNTNLQGFAKI